MSYSSLLGSIQGIDQSINEIPLESGANNLGSFIYNIFRLFSSMAKNLRDFFTSTVTIGGEDVSIWLLCATGGFITVLIIILIAKFT